MQQLIKGIRIVPFNRFFRLSDTYSAYIHGKLADIIMGRVEI
jgi:hypothetical protein